MGWDAYAKKDNKDMYNYIENKFYDEILGEIFKKSSKELKNTCGVDGLLSKGGLDCRNCEEMLQQSIFSSEIIKNLYNCYEDWSEMEVAIINDHANWNFEYNQEDEWAYKSAKEFLRICAENNLSIYFSY